MDPQQRSELIKTVGIVIAIDGPAGSGKSTVSRRLAQLLGIGYLDTGAMYRALTWYALDRQVNLADQTAVVDAAQHMPLTMVSDPLDPHYFMGSKEITTAIREPRIATAISQVSTNLAVRHWMAAEQRRRMLEARAHGSGMIAEGRDITTVVSPDADVKILLLASTQERLRRRARELYGDDLPEHVEATRPQVEDRDAKDATVTEFMTPAQGVHVVDSSGLDIDGVIAHILQLVDADLLSRAACHTVG